jgi:hypothetical protein
MIEGTHYEMKDKAVLVPWWKRNRTCIYDAFDEEEPPDH